jgi:hypothetical protein
MLEGDAARRLLAAERSRQPIRPLSFAHSPHISALQPPPSVVADPQDHDSSAG